jgi:hypothetical protein
MIKGRCNAALLNSDLSGTSSHRSHSVWQAPPVLSYDTRIALLPFALDPNMSDHGNFLKPMGSGPEEDIPLTLMMSGL